MAAPGTVRDLLERGWAQLVGSSESSRLDAEILLAHALRRPRSYLLAHDNVAVEEATIACYQSLLARAAQGEPLAYLIGEREWSLMKKTAILINTCRGPVVDEVALYNALNNEVIMAAGLDVMVEEPPKPDHQLFTLKNAIFSPHAAGPTWDNHWKRWRNAFDNCERVARGQKAFWIVPELR